MKLRWRPHQSSHRRCSVKKGVLKNFTQCTGKCTHNLLLHCPVYPNKIFVLLRKMQIFFKINLGSVKFCFIPHPSFSLDVYLVALSFKVCLYVYMYIYLVFSTDELFEVATENWPEWDLNPWPLNSVLTL